MNRKKIESLDERIFADLEIKIEKEINKEIELIKMDDVIRFRHQYHQLFQIKYTENTIIESIENELNKEVSRKPEKENN